MSTCRHSGAVKSLWPRYLECSWVLPSAYDCSRLLKSARCVEAPCSLVILIAHDCIWAFKSAHDRSLELMSVQVAIGRVRVHGCSWAFICTNERSQALLSTHRQSWPIQHTHEDGAVAQSALMSTQEHSWQHGNIILTASECPQVLISAHEC